MKSTLAAVALLVASTNAAVMFTNSQYDIQAGQPFTLDWSGASGPVTITLKNGPTSSLQSVETIDSNDSSGSFTWTPPDELVSGTYAFSITDGSGTNYSPQWTYSGNPTGTLGATTGAATITGTASSSGTASASATASMSITSSSSASASTATSASSSSSGSSTKTSSMTTASSSSSSPSASASSTKAPSNTNDGQRFSSPLAFILVTVAALVYFN